MNNEVAKIDFFDQVAYSVQPSKYSILGNLPRKKVVMFLLNLATVLSIMTFLVPVVGFLIGVGGPEKLIMESLPAIELKGGQLNVSSKIEVGQGSLAHLLVDTSVEKVPASAIDQETYSTEIIIGKTNAMVYADTLGIIEYDFSQAPELTMTNETLMSMLPMMLGVLALSFLWNLLGNVCSYLLSAAMLALACWGPFHLRGTHRISFFKTLTYSIYAKAVVELVLAFNNSVGLIKSPVILMYAGIFVTLGLLINGIRRAEGE